MKFINRNKLLLVLVLSITSFSVLASKTSSGKMTENLKRMANEKASMPNYVLRNNQNKYITSFNNTSDKLLVEITTNNLTENDRSSFELPGVTIKAYSIKYNRISLEFSDMSQLSKIEDNSKVVIMSPNYGYINHRGAITSRALETMNAPIPLNVTGAGQKIGIISNSFARTPGMTGEATIRKSGNTSPISLTGTLSQLSDDLPPTIDLRNDNISSERQFDLPPTDEGAAMAELIYDIAPGSAIAFHSAGGSIAEFANAIDDLCTAANSTIVVDDVLFFAEPVYQSGIIAQSATNCVANGVLFFSAIGNSENRALRQKFKDINSVLNDSAPSPTGNDFHDWGNGTGFLKLTLKPGGFFQAELQWNQPSEMVAGSKGAEIDLNLYAYSSANINSTILLKSNNIQGVVNNALAPKGNAREVFAALNTGTGEKIYYLAIDNYIGNLVNIPQDSNTPLEFSLIFFGDAIIEGITNNTSQFGGPTTYGHAAAPGVISVAAVPWYDNTNPEYFTSRGGDLTIFFDKDGNFNPITKFVPDITAVNRNNTTFFGNDIPDTAGIPGEPDGFPNFAGTSASAPNAAAVAVLALEIDPTLTPTQLITILKNTATDIVGTRGAVGIDDVTGAGLINISTFLASVSAGNRPPVIGDIVDVTIIEGGKIDFTIPTTDFDKDIPVISITNKPTNAEFTDNLDGTASFVWTTTKADVNEYTISFTATDGNSATPGSDTKTIKILVTDIPPPPPPVAKSDSGGCTLNKTAKFDPLFPSLLLFFSALYLVRKYKKR